MNPTPTIPTKASQQWKRRHTLDKLCPPPVTRRLGIAFGAWGGEGVGAGADRLFPASSDLGRAWHGRKKQETPIWCPHSTLVPVSRAASSSKKLDKKSPPLKKIMSTLPKKVSRFCPSERFDCVSGCPDYFSTLAGGIKIHGPKNNKLFTAASSLLGL